MRLTREIKSIISTNKDVRNGAPVFKGTRVPVSFVLEHIALGWSLKDLKEIFPTVNLEHVKKLIGFYSKEFKYSNESTNKI